MPWHPSKNKISIPDLRSRHRPVADDVPAEHVLGGGPFEWPTKSEVSAGLKKLITNFGRRRVARVVEWLSLANCILVFAQRLLDTAEVPVTPQGARDARVIALALVGHER